jgi:hypothetical protein
VFLSSLELLVTRRVKQPLCCNFKPVQVRNAQAQLSAHFIRSTLVARKPMKTMLARHGMVELFLVVAHMPKRSWWLRCLRAMDIYTTSAPKGLPNGSWSIGGVYIFPSQGRKIYTPPVLRLLLGSPLGALVVYISTARGVVRTMKLGVRLS